MDFSSVLLHDASANAQTDSISRRMRVIAHPFVALKDAVTKRARDAIPIIGH